MIYLILLLLLARYTDGQENPGTRGGVLKETFHNGEALLETRSTELSCYEPNPEPILGVHDSSRIINVGLPKIGTTSLFWALAHVPDRNVTHWFCLNEGFCAPCMWDAISNGKSPMASCANTWAYTELDYISPGSCFMPQVTHLDQFYEENPTATFILPFRPAEDWVHSIDKFWDFRNIIEKQCAFPEFGFELGFSKSDEAMEAFYCDHVKRVRSFVKKHPSLSLIEYNIYDEDVGSFLEPLIPGFDASYWGKFNVESAANGGKLNTGHL